MQFRAHNSNGGHMSKSVEITSLKDASYQGCISSERSSTIGKFIHTKCPSFLESIPDEIKAEIEAGQMLRFNELHPAQYYTDNWTPCEPDTKGAKKVDINVVMAYSQQVFGTFRTDDPVKHGIHKTWRDDWSDYKSNRTKDLKRYVKAYLDSLTGKKRERASTKDFSVWLKEDLLPSLKARAKTAKARGDATVDDAVVNAIAKVIK
jgi:hypothetical protein